MRSLRYYEEKGLLNPIRLQNGYREYDGTDIERVRIIQLYFSLGLHTKEIIDFFQCAFSEEIKYQCLPNAIEVGETKLDEIRKQIETLRKAESHLNGCISSWREMLRKGASGNNDK